MAGVDQFLGTQLDNQAKALADLVIKMQEMVINQEASIEKYTQASDEVQEQWISPNNDYDTKLPSSGKITVQLYFKGTIKVKLDLKNSDAIYNRAIEVFQNASRVYLKDLNPNNQVTDTTEIIVEEGDVIEIRGDSFYHLYKEISFRYTFINKPTTIIVE